MYFALIPDKKSKAELVSLVQDPLEEFHLTVLFSPDRETRIPPEEVQALLVGGTPPPAVVNGLHNFGPADRKVWALRLIPFDGPYSWLVPLRQRCEKLLTKYGIPWDKTWPFNPHLTISKRDGITLHRALPEQLSFDRIELRY
jgi:2'-5' RNA ligase